jgi:hypothetical protein
MVLQVVIELALNILIQLKKNYIRRFKTFVIKIKEKGLKYGCTKGRS